MSLSEMPICELCTISVALLEWTRSPLKSSQLIRRSQSWQGNTLHLLLNMGSKWFMLEMMIHAVTPSECLAQENREINLYAACCIMVAQLQYICDNIRQRGGTGENLFIGTTNWWIGFSGHFVVDQCSASLYLYIFSCLLFSKVQNYENAFRVFI